MIATDLRKDWAATDEIPDGKDFDAYYDVHRKHYWIKNSRGSWIPVAEKSLNRHLKKAGFFAEKGRGEALSELDQKLIEIQCGRDVAYAGPVAGHSIGVEEICGNRILVSSSPRLIQPQQGEWPTIAAVAENLFNDPVCDQRPFVFGWTKIAVEALRAGAYRPGQALAMAGPRNSGKSLWQGLETEMLGGRAAKPYRYMSDKTTFNADLIGAEHLMIEDEVASTDNRTRRHFGARMKDFTVNQMQSCHPKNGQAISLTPFWRLSISLNEEPENLLILPPIDESLADKIMLIRTRKLPMPMPTGTLAERAAFWNKLVSELPAFLHSLLNMEIPAELRCERFGVKHYHHPDLLAAIDALAHESRLLALIDAHFWPAPDETARVKATPPTSLRLTAEQLEQGLFESAFGFEARRLLDWNNATGTYLGRLATKHPERIQRDRQANGRFWQIFPPTEKDDEAKN